MPKQTGIAAKTKIKPTTLIASMAAAAVGFLVYLYFASASGSCIGRAATINAGEECATNIEAGQQVVFGYASTAPFSFIVTHNGEEVSSKNQHGPGAGCHKSTASEGGYFAFKVVSGSARVVSGSCEIPGQTASLSCKPESRKAIVWTAKWNNIKDYVSVAVDGKLAYQSSLKTGKKAVRKGGFRPKTTHTAVVKNKAGTVLATASCRTKG